MDYSILFDRNNLKLGFIVFLNLLLFFQYLISRKHFILKREIRTLLFSFFLISLHSMFFSFKKFDSLVESSLAILFLLAIYFISRIFGSSILRSLIENILFLMSTYLISTSTFILIFFNYPQFYSSGNFKGLTENSNTLGLYFLFITPYVLEKLIFNQRINRIKKLTGFIILMDIIWIVFKTRSRSAFIIMLLVIGLSFIWNELKIHNRKKTFIIISGFTIISLGFFSNAFLELMKKNNKKDESIFSTREVLWQARIYAISQKPLLGWGYAVNEFSEFRIGHKNNPKEKGNIVLAVIEEFGIILGSTLLIIWYQIFKKVIAIHRKQPGQTYLAIMLIGLLIHSLAETWILNFYSFLAYIFWMIIIYAFGSNTEHLIQKQ